MSQLKVYINKEIEPVIKDFASKNLMKPTDAAGYLLAYAVQMLEKTGAQSIPELLEKSETGEVKLTTPSLEPVKPKKPNGNVALNSL
jgi:hypothetical protein